MQLPKALRLMLTRAFQKFCKVKLELKRSPNLCCLLLCIFAERNRPFFFNAFICLLPGIVQSLSVSLNAGRSTLQSLLTSPFYISTLSIELQSKATGGRPKAHRGFWTTRLPLLALFGFSFAIVSLFGAFAVFLVRHLVQRIQTAFCFIEIKGRIRLCMVF